MADEGFHRLLQERRMVLPGAWSKQLATRLACAQAKVSRDAQLRCQQARRVYIG